MNTKLNKIFKSFEEVNLESHQVELGLVDDFKILKTNINNYSSIINKMYEESQKTEKLFKDVISQKEKIQKLYIDNKSFLQDKTQKDLNNFFKMAQKTASDIGLQATELPFYKEYQDLRLLIDKMIDKNQNSWNILSKI